MMEIQYWERLGLVVTPGRRTWSKTHALLPTPAWEDGRLRIYYGTCDENGDGQIAWVEVDPNSPTSIVAQSSEPVLSPGQIGNFDDSGVAPSCIVGNFLYYNGFQRTEKAGALIFQGLADRRGENFLRRSDVPILERQSASPNFRAGGFVLAEDGGYRLWFLAGTGLVGTAKGPIPSYEMRTLASTDGVTWVGNGTLCLAPDSSRGETGLSRPWVHYDSETYRMWFSVRRLVDNRVKYTHLGYAESCDGVNWRRHDPAVVLQGPIGNWESEMVCYPAVFFAAGEQYLLYCGNDNGKVGFGIARRRRFG